MALPLVWLGGLLYHFTSGESLQVSLFKVYAVLYRAPGTLYWLTTVWLQKLCFRTAVCLLRHACSALWVTALASCLFHLQLRKQTSGVPSAHQSFVHQSSVQVRSVSTVCLVCFCTLLLLLRSASTHRLHAKCTIPQAQITQCQSDMGGNLVFVLMHRQRESRLYRDPVHAYQLWLDHLYVTLIVSLILVQILLAMCAVVFVSGRCEGDGGDHIACGLAHEPHFPVWPLHLCGGSWVCI